VRLDATIDTGVLLEAAIVAADGDGSRGADPVLPAARKLGHDGRCDKGYGAAVCEVIAHRGASRLSQENTVAAFEIAAIAGADGAELDVRRTADGVLVVHHDARVSDGRVIVGTPWRELPAYVPTLGQALDACAGMWVDIEIKNDPRDPDFDPDDRVAVEVLAELAERGPGRWLLSSFRLETIDRCRRVDPTVPTAWLTVQIGPDTVERLVAAGHTAVNPWEVTLTPEQVERCHEAGLLVNAWTCNDPARFLALAASGVDGIVTDVPDVMRAALGGGPAGSFS
jgi:glycerophosphoryl diester phosphodiesterase